MLAGKPVTQLIYDTILPFREGMAIVGMLQRGRFKTSGKYGFLDTTGREVFPPVFDDIDYNSSYLWGNRRRVQRNGRFGFVDTYTGRLVVPLRYESSLPSGDSLCCLKLNGRWGLVLHSGRTLIPFQYDQVSTFTEGLARVGKDGRFGHINGRGEVVTPLQYDNVFPFREGRAMVILGTTCGFVDTRGREVMPAVYSSGQSYFKDGKVTVSRWGILLTLDRTGRQVNYRLSGRPKTALAGALLLGMLGAGYWVYRRNNRPAAAAAYPEVIEG